MTTTPSTRSPATETQPLEAVGQRVYEEQPFGPSNGRRRIGLVYPGQHPSDGRSCDLKRRAQVQTWTRLPKVRWPRHTD